MRRFWKKQLPALLLALIMTVSLVPAAMAVGCTSESGEHTWGDWTTTQEATCIADGVKQRTCSICNATETESIPALGHDFTGEVADYTPATCTAAGSQTIQCRRCDATTTRSIDPLGHDWEDEEIIAEANCGKAGSKRQKCRVCGVTQTVTIPATGNHTYGAWMTTKEATCTAAGTETATCSVCGATKTQTVKALGHIDMNKDGICDRCFADLGTKITVTFRTLTASGSYTSTTQDVTKGQYPNPPTPSSVTINGQTYTFKCWMKGTTSNYVYSNQTQAYPANETVSAAVTYSALYTANTNTVKVTYYYPSSKLIQQTSTKDVPVNGYAASYVPSVSSSFTYNGETYTFKGWATYASGTQWYLTPNSYIISNWNAYRVTSAANFYAIYEAEDENTITYTVNAGKEEEFVARDFKKLHDNDCSDTFEYVTFSVNKTTYNNFSGSVYCGDTELSYSDLKDRFYYDEDDAGKNDYLLEDLSLVAPKGAKDASITLSFTTYGDKNKTTTGTLKLVVGDDADDTTIVYEVAPGKTVDFSRTDFNKVYQTEYSGSFSYVEFDKPGTTAFSEGTLYSGYTSASKYTEKFTRTNLSSYSFYYNSASGSNSYNLNTLTFVADSDFEDTVKLTFRVYGSSSKYVDGTVEIRSTDSASSGDVTYTAAAGKEVTFDEDDFQSVYRKEYSSGTIRWVEFTAPSTLTSAGTVYYDYGYKDQKSFTRTTLNNTKFYYGSSSSYGDYALDDLSFVASTSFNSSVSISFRAYYSDSKYVDGTLVIKSGSSSSGDITYKAAPSKQVVFDEDDFQTVYRKEYTGTIKWVEFTAPAALTNAGTIHYDYGYKDEKSFTRSTLNSTKFYYGSSSSSGDYALDDLSFVASSSFFTAVSVPFRAYYSDSKYVDGTMILQPDTAAAAASTYVGSIRYATTTGTRVQINANDIARYFKKNTGATMQYVTLTGVPSTGSLYYNYYNTSKYGTTTRAQITASNAGGQAFYASPTSTSQFALTELTYVPSGTNYCAAIPFTAYGGSRSVTGAILISVSSSAVSEVYGVTPKNTAVTFPASSISSAVVKATGTTPASIQLLSLPSYTAGTVYVGTGTTTANTTTAYAIFSGAQSLRFVPASTYTGSVEIPYVALNSSGTAIASGTFSLGVLNSNKKFSDVTTSTWCYKYVAELSDAGVIDGYTNGSFKPDSTVTYGAALKLIMLAAGYPEQAPTSSSSVFSGYLAKARADGIITVSNVNLSKPITRLQVAQIAAGAMKLDTTNLSSVSPFTDTTNTSVQALNAAGIVEGYFSNGTSTFKPNNTLTRGQVSAIVWRMRNYNK